MPKYRMVVSVTTTAYVGDIEAGTQLEAWDAARKFCKQFKEKSLIDPYQADDDRLEFDKLERLEIIRPGDDAAYIPAKWR